MLWTGTRGQKRTVKRTQPLLNCPVTALQDLHTSHFFVSFDCQACDTMSAFSFQDIKFSLTNQRNGSVIKNIADKYHSYNLLLLDFKNFYPTLFTWLNLGHNVE